jgi:hypothetical protein
MSRDENPYAAPLAAADEIGPLRKKLPRDLRFWLRFAAALAVMAIANVMPLYFTWKAYQLDGREVTGWPFVFRERVDGSSYAFYPEYLAADVAIAIGVAYAVARALRDGWLTLLRRLRKAVIDDVD